MKQANNHESNEQDGSRKNIMNWNRDASEICKNAKEHKAMKRNQYMENEMKRMRVTEKVCIG